MPRSAKMTVFELQERTRANKKESQYLSLKYLVMCLIFGDNAVNHFVHDEQLEDLLKKTIELKDRYVP